MDAETHNIPPEKSNQGKLFSGDWVLVGRQKPEYH
jgi:hypothetical protein